MKVYLLQGLLGWSPLQLGVAVSAAALAPVLMLPSFTKLSALSLVGCISTIMVVLSLVGTVASDPLRRHMPVQVRCCGTLSTDSASAPAATDSCAAASSRSRPVAQHLVPRGLASLQCLCQATPACQLCGGACGNHR